MRRSPFSAVGTGQALCSNAENVAEQGTDSEGGSCCLLQAHTGYGTGERAEMGLCVDAAQPVKITAK